MTLPEKRKFSETEKDPRNSIEESIRSESEIHSGRISRETGDLYQNSIGSFHLAPFESSQSPQPPVSLPPLSQIFKPPLQIQLISNSQVQLLGSDQSQLPFQIQEARVLTEGEMLDHPQVQAQAQGQALTQAQAQAQAQSPTQAQAQSPTQAQAQALTQAQAQALTQAQAQAQALTQAQAQAQARARVQAQVQAHAQARARAHVKAQAQALAQTQAQAQALGEASTLANQQALIIINDFPERGAIEYKVKLISDLGSSVLDELTDPKHITNLLLLINLFKEKDNITHKKTSQFEKIFSNNNSRVVFDNLNQKKSVKYVLENFDNLFKPLIETFPRRNLASMLFLSDEIKASKILSELVLLIKTPQFEKLKDILPSNYGSFVSKTANSRQNPENFLSQILDNIDSLNEIKKMGFDDNQLSRIFYTSHDKIRENIESFLENKDFINQIIESKSDIGENINNLAYFLATIARVGFRELIPKFKELFKSSAIDFLNQIEKNLNRPRTTIKDIKVELSQPRKGFDERILAEIISKLDNKNTYVYVRAEIPGPTIEQQQNAIMSRILGREYIYNCPIQKLIEDQASPSAQTKTSARSTEAVSASTTLEK